ncbi:uncharacterized protein LOC142098453 [Mixophyes fleayi]|uniref:uncharacterized protein LOC142098453 n=1 Tax=Mixophyes fleayi TaxID=3061075 RepID=UPI003F4E3B0B
MSVTRFLLLFWLQTGAALELNVPPTQKAMMGADVQIPCSFTVNKPPVDRTHLSIVWHFQGKEILSVGDKGVIKTDPRVSYIDRATVGIADLSIFNITLSDGGMYTCSVLYSPERKEKEVRLDIQAPPHIQITSKTVLNNKESILRSSINGFYPEDIDIKWFKDGEILDRITVDTLLRHPDGTFSVNSSVIITPTEEDRERIFSCRVQHQSLNGPLQEDFQLVYGAAPSVSIISPIFKVNVEETLVCQVSGFYPESIAVYWLLNGMLVENTKTRNITRSSVESNYQFLPTEENWGTKISCVVEHDSLIHPHVETLLVVWKDLTARYKVHVVIVAIVLVCALGTIIIVVLLIRYKRKWLPKARNIVCSTDGRLSMNVDHFYPKDISVCWTVIQPPSSTKHKTLESTVIMEENQDGTFNVTSSCETLRDKVIVNEPYIVRAVVTHQKLKHPIHREWDSEKSDIKLEPKLQQPIQLSISDSGDLMGSLSLLNFYPKDISVTWTCGHTEKIQSEETVSENSDGTFTSNTKCNIPVTLLITPVRVTWKQGTMEEPEYREISVRGPDFPWRPRIEDMTPLIVQKNQTSNLSCRISAYFPEDLKVTWLEKRGQSECNCASNTLYNIPPITPVRLADNSWTCTPALSFTPTSVYEGLEFICRVEHPSLENPIELNTGPAREKVPPQVGEHVKFTLCESDHVLCSMSFMKFYPQNINITWTYGDQNNMIPSIKKIIQTDDEKTFDAKSECKVPWKYFQSLVRVTWSHVSLTGHQRRDVRITDFPWRPVIEEIDKPALLVNTEVRLQYKISGYFPDYLTVIWYKKEATASNLVPVTKRNTSITGAQKQPDNTYSYTGCLVFTPSLMYQGSELICRVEHPSLEQPIERSTGALQVEISLKRMLKALIVVIPKPGKDPWLPESYLPISLLFTDI